MDTVKKQSKWTDWTVIEDDSMMGMYKTNHKKVRVKLSDDFVGESCCSKFDEFDLDFGIRMAYLRCMAKMWKKGRDNIDKEIDAIEGEVKEMINSLYN